MRWVIAVGLAASIAGVPTASWAAPAADKIELLRTRPTGMDEREWKVKRREIARDLASNRSTESTDALLEIVNTERYDAVLTIAIQSLAQHGDPRAIDPLQRIYADRSIDNFVREEAGKAIVALGGTPHDDARLVGGDTSTGSTDGVLSGPQLGTMGAASAPQEVPPPTLKRQRKLPEKVVARDRELAFVLGTLGLRVNTLVRDQAVLANAGLGVVARYLDERQRWGWNVAAALSGSIRNGDLTAVANSSGGDDGNTLFIRQALDVSADVHVYFGPTLAHAFVQAGVAERVNHISVDDLEATGFDDSNLRDTRFAFDLTPAAGLGWGRYLNAGSDLLVDAVVAALKQENILARPLSLADRRALIVTLYRYANNFSSYPRVAAILQLLSERGYLARSPGPRLVHRLRSIVEDPSFRDRWHGIRVRAGFLYGATLGQGNYFRREGDDIAAPFLQFDAGAQLSLERQIVADTRFWYDVIGQRGFTTDSGITYTRFFHSPFSDYRGQWFAGIRGGVSQRAFPDLGDDIDGDGDNDTIFLGYRALGQAGYAYGFRRGSEIRVTAHAGADSGGFVAGVDLGFRLGIGRGSLLVAGPAGRTFTRSPPSGGAASSASATTEDPKAPAKP